jgi:hypothetical protein
MRLKCSKRVLPAVSLVVIICTLATLFGSRQDLTVLMNYVKAPDSTPSYCATDEDMKYPIPVFYNLFVAQESDAPRVRDIVTEQFAYLRPEHRVHLHSIGYPIEIANTTLLQHHDEGDEIDTLHSLWEYCNIRPESKVVYMHSKGSFTPSKENDALRRFLTAGALSIECMELPDTCNICSSRMSPLPHP